MTTETPNAKRNAVVFPKNQKFLAQLGENIKLARLRRHYTQTLISERTGLSRITIRKIEAGDSKVSLLGLVEDLAKVASDDQLGRKLQDIELMGKQK